VILFTKDQHTLEYWLEIGTASEIAAICGLGRSAIYQWRNRGIPETAVRILALYYGITKPDDFEDFVEQEVERLKARQRAWQSKKGRGREAEKIGI
jgi:hypothetical protein